MRAGFVLFCCLSMTAVGCRESPPGTAKEAKSFHMRGRIVSTDAASGEVTISHQAIPGYMEAMTMPYKLAQPGIVDELHPQDMITADLVLRKDGPVVDHIVVVGQARPDNLPKVQYHAPQPGEAVPDFHLLNQSGNPIHLDQFKGRVLLLTFIYTRCPVADFCPRMSANFAEIDQALAADPKLYAATHLLSVSFDPAYDTPAVLRSYGGAHTGRFTKETFGHWEFAVPPASELPQVEQFFNVGVTPGEERQLTHSLSTVLIGKDGRIVAWYPSNEWKPAEVLAQMEQAVKELP
jgi:protein SCO1/2